MNTKKALLDRAWTADRKWNSLAGGNENKPSGIHVVGLLSVDISRWMQHGQQKTLHFEAWLQMPTTHSYHVTQ